MHLTGRGGANRRATNTAAAWYLRAAEAGSPDAQAMLGWMHEVGRGVPKDLGEVGPLVPARGGPQGNTVARDHLKYRSRPCVPYPGEAGARAVDEYVPHRAGVADRLKGDIPSPEGEPQP